MGVQSFKFLKILSESFTEFQGTNENSQLSFTSIDYLGLLHRCPLLLEFWGQWSLDINLHWTFGKLTEVFVESNCPYRPEFYLCCFMVLKYYILEFASQYLSRINHCHQLSVIARFLSLWSFIIGHKRLMFLKLV